jgi:small ligand-binding sensory domain FIST
MIDRMIAQMIAFNGWMCYRFARAGRAISKLQGWCFVMGNDAERFGFGHAAGGDWRAVTLACVEQITPPPGANLGFVYITDVLAPELGNITQLLAERTGVENWVGTTGIGVCATGREYMDEPAMAAMVGYFPEGSFGLFAGFGDDRDGFLAGIGPWAAKGEGYFALVHGDPRQPELMAQVPELAAAADCFLVGGLASSQGAYASVAGALTEGTLSGVMFSDQVPVATGLSQGCSPIGPVREVTRCENNIAIQIDGRPALDVFKEDIGDILARDMQRVAGYIFAAFPVAGSDRADYMVRNLVGIDEAQNVLAIGAPLETGDRIMFCRRDRQSARKDLDRMLDDLLGRAGGPEAGKIKGAVYFTCLGRGANMFGAPSAELQAIQEKLGDVPLVGFACNGEISHNRVYSYTGVLSLFL